MRLLPDFIHVPQPDRSTHVYFEPGLILTWIFFSFLVTGFALAAVLSWSRNHSFVMAALHAQLNWLYVLWVEFVTWVLA